MRIAFMGTPVFAARLLSAVVEAGFDVAAVYTQPQKPRGRGKILRPTPVQEVAESFGLRVVCPESMKTPEALQELLDLRVDAAVVAAFGQILTQPVLDAPRLGSFNVHASLLPRWRGAAPIQRAVMAGDTETGVQVMRMTAGLDEGPILSERRVPIEPDDTAGDLHDRLLAAAEDLLPPTLRMISEGRAEERAQTAEGAVYARKITSRETRIDWTRSAVDIDRLIRGLAPQPGAWFELPTPKGPVRVKALGSRLGLGRGAPGEALDAELLIACGEGAVRLTRVQREGRTPQAGDEFARGLLDPANVILA